MEMFQQLIVNVSLEEALEQMSGYAKFVKDPVMKKRAVSYKLMDNLHYCSAISTRSLVQKKEDPGPFNISCTIRSLEIAKALCDLGVSINLMSLAIYKNLGLGDPTPTNMRLMMADKLVASFIFPMYFVILDYEVDFKVPIILGRPFFATESVLIDLQANEFLFRMNDEVVLFYVCQSMKKDKEMSVFSIVDVYYEDEQEVPIEEKFDVEPLATVLINFDREGIAEYEETVCALIGMGSYYYTLKHLDLDLFNQLTPSAKPSVEEPPELELKKLLGHLQYVFLGNRNTLPIIIIADLGEK
ncbi:uncharacterized protein LOC124896157 [Capsicum annuum]|uniref:uncharacterized protein LOC124896157 n=1 Tax=Capsicum annuum TaxID=4072 RepID=UPI001FB0ADD8|nr:uncharacterized protein LOC124896157 [Capsicum annuum]